MTANANDVMTLSGRWSAMLAVWSRNGTMTIKREQCDNCGRFVKWYTLSFDEDMQTIVCHHCEPSVEFEECDNDVATLLVDDDPFKWR